LTAQAEGSALSGNGSTWSEGGAAQAGLSEEKATQASAARQIPAEARTIDYREVSVVDSTADE
jgi:hypothetical protein